MTTFYATPDVANSARVKYENCKQKPDETVESYFLRHREAIDNLVDDLKASWHVFKFTQGLQPKYSNRWREYPDLLDPEKTTAEEITRRLTADERMLRGASKGLGGGASNSSHSDHGHGNGSRRDNNKKSAEHRLNSSSQRSFKKKGSKLSRGTLKSLQDMIKRGGGEKVDRNVQASTE